MNIPKMKQNFDNGNLGENSDSQIGKFYAGKHVLLTGSTGLLGTVILERLLHQCPEIAKVYLMIRPKRGVPENERLANAFKDIIFDNVREKNPNFMKKVVLVQGDLQKTGLGFSPEDRKRLLENLDIIIHNASIVYFTGKPSVVLRTNVLGTKEMLELAAACSHLKAFIYVSTAFSHFYNKHVKEKFYPPPADIKMIESVIQADEQNAGGLSNQAVQDIVGNFINIYIFSKAVTEGVVETFAKTASFPCIVFRPAIVLGTYAESMPPWIENNNAPSKSWATLYTGLLHVLYMGDNSTLDIIPVDMTVNFLLALIWNHVTNRRSTEVYNYASSDWNPCYMTRTPLKAIMRKYPSRHAIWYPFYILTTNYYLFYTYHTLFHVIPAGIADFILLVWKQEKPKFLKIVWKASANIGLYITFMNINLITHTDKAKELLTCMNADDKKAFAFNLSLIDWSKSTVRFINALRYMLKETPEDLEVAKAKLRKLKILHYTIIASFAFLLLVFLYHTMCNFFY